MEKVKLSEVKVGQLFKSPYGPIYRKISCDVNVNSTRPAASTFAVRWPGGTNFSCYSDDGVSVVELLNDDGTEIRGTVKWENLSPGDFFYDWEDDLCIKMERSDASENDTVVVSTGAQYDMKYHSDEILYKANAKVVEN